MIRRLICLARKHQGLRHHQPRFRREWVFGSRVVWMTICFNCKVQLAEGNSDSWIITDWMARELLNQARTSMDFLVSGVLSDRT